MKPHDSLESAASAKAGLAGHGYDFRSLALQEFILVAKLFFAPIYGTYLVLKEVGLASDASQMRRSAAPVRLAQSQRRRASDEDRAPVLHAGE